MQLPPLPSDIANKIWLIMAVDDIFFTTCGLELDSFLIPVYSSCSIL
jgi:hypothetical protein